MWGSLAWLKFRLIRFLSKVIAKKPNWTHCPGRTIGVFVNGDCERNNNNNDDDDDGDDDDNNGTVINSSNGTYLLGPLPLPPPKLSDSHTSTVSGPWHAMPDIHGGTTCSSPETRGRQNVRQSEPTPSCGRRWTVLGVWPPHPAQCCRDVTRRCYHAWTTALTRVLASTLTGQTNRCH